MLPVIAIVGRPNVGKSTLFNYLTRTRDAIVADLPGVTRDRQYGHGHVEEQEYIVIDTGGMCGDIEGLDSIMEEQAKLAIDEADAVIFMVDGRGGLTSADETIANDLRSVKKPVFLAINKTDGVDSDIAMGDFYSLGFKNMLSIAASHGRGLTQLIQAVLDNTEVLAKETAITTERQGIHFAIVGKPNVGKSTLTNRILGEERVLVFDAPGTTRDSVFIPFERQDKSYTLIDTAGVRRRSRVTKGVEKFSVIKTLQAIDACHVVLMVIDARENISEQDQKLLGHVIRSGKSLVIAINKWDGMDSEDKDSVKREISRRLEFVSFAKLHFISAKHGTGVGELFKSIQAAYRSAMIEITTSQANDILQAALEDHQPPSAKGRRIKLRYANVGGSNPPTIVIHGNLTNYLPDSYKRYLANYFSKSLKLVGTPMRMLFRTGDNPYKGHRSKDTPRQARNKKRMRKLFKK